MKDNSPLQDPEIMEETKETAKQQYGEKVNEFFEDETQNKTGFERFPDVEEVDGEDIGSSKQSLNFDYLTKIVEGTDHLPGFDIMDKDLGLDGKSYNAPKKALYYYQNSLRQNTVQSKINHKTKIDNREHLLIITSPGAGKTTIKNQNKRILKDYETEDGCIEVSGVSHPEQLVGKIKYKKEGKKKIAEPVLGLMGYRCCMNDESQEMLNEKNEVYAKAQRIKRIAMDSYGENKISKKLVDDKPDESLSYFSPTRLCDFAHPEKLEDAFFKTGSFRRYFAFNISNDETINLNDVTDFSFDNPKEFQKSWKDFLDEKYENQVDVNFTQETLNIISHFHKCLLYYLLNHKNDNAMRYGLLTKYSMRNIFCKNVLILSIIKNEETPSLNTVLSACSDTVLFILKTIETYNELGNMGLSSDVWGGVNEQDAQALEFLLKKKALSKETSTISIKRFQTVLGNFYGCKRTQSRSHHYRLKRNGFINSAQEGKYGSKVWLKFIPKEIKLDADNFDSLKFWDKYFEGDSGKKAFLTSLKDMFIDDKVFQKAQGDGGVGVMACLLIKYYICVEVLDKNKNKNNIYKRRGANTVTPDTLIQIPQKQPIQASNPENKGVKTPQNPVTPSNKTGSDRDVQYFHHKECSDIKESDLDEVKKFIKKNPKPKDKELINKFGPGIIKLKKEGLI